MFSQIDPGESYNASQCLSVSCELKNKQTNIQSKQNESTWHCTKQNYWSVQETEDYIVACNL